MAQRNMNHTKLYKKLIEKAVARDGVIGYSEIHHIIPRALKGTDKKENLVTLTAREHFIAHWFLAKIYGGCMWSALLLFKGLDNKYHNSRLYEVARQKVAKETSIRMTGNKASNETKSKMSKAHTGKKFSEEAKQNMSKARKGETRRPMSEDAKENLRKINLGKTLSEEHKQKISIAHNGRTFTAKHKENLSKVRIGVKKSDATRAKMSARWLNKPSDDIRKKCQILLKKHGTEEKE